MVAGQPKGAIVGSVAGVTAAAGYVQQGRRLKRVASRQEQFSELEHRLVNTLQDRDSIADLNSQMEEKIKNFESSVEEQKADIAELKNVLRSKSGQTRLTQIEINQIRTKLLDLESKSSKDLLDNSGGDVYSTEQFQEKLTELEVRVDGIQSTIAKGINNSETETSETETIEQDLYISDLDDDAAGEAAQEVIDWLKSKQVEVESYYEPDPKIDHLLDGLSIYLGDNYSVLKDFHWKLRTTVGGRFHFNLGSYDARERRILNQYLKKLKASDYLSHGRLVKNIDKPDIIIAASHDRSDIQGFYDGGWFERFAYYKIIDLFDSKGINYQYLRNAKITYQDEGTSELDLLFLFEEKPLLIECKAGANYDSGIGKFAKHREKLGVDPRNAIFVLLVEIDESEAHIRSRNWGITVVDRNHLLDHISNITLVEEAADVQEEDTDIQERVVSDVSGEDGQGVPVLESSTLEAFFREKGSNRAPEFRTFVLDELIQVIGSMDKTTSFNELVRIVRDRVKENHSLGIRKITEILNCLRFSKVFRNSTNKFVTNASHHISSMTSMRRETLEKKCIEFYVRKILLEFDPEFFDREENIQEFERLVHGQAPSFERIKQLKEKLL